jgi:hypothetical protein
MMNLKNMANAIIASVMGSPQLEDADRERVLRQLQELHCASLEEAAQLICPYCRKGLERKLLGDVYAHPVPTSADSPHEDICRAGAIWKALEEEQS